MYFKLHQVNVSRWKGCDIVLVEHYLLSLTCRMHHRGIQYEYVVYCL